MRLPALLVAIALAGYAFFQLTPVWFQNPTAREKAQMRRQAATLFVDVLLIAYPVTLCAAVLGASVLMYLKVRARTSSIRRRDPDVPKILWQSRLLLLCCSTLLGLAICEAGAAAWRSRLNRSPVLPSLAAQKEKAGERDLSSLGGTEEPELGRFQSEAAPASARHKRGACEFW